MGEMIKDREIDGNFQTSDKIGCHAQGLIRDRIRELRRVRAADLLRNPKNWRRHPKAQADALRGLLAEVGYADALLVRELPDGRLMLSTGIFVRRQHLMPKFRYWCSTLLRKKRTRSC
jgi:hypothetical protein